MEERATHLESARIDLGSLALARTGRAYDLSSGWWRGMPVAPGHPPFQVSTYRTPGGVRLERDLSMFDDNPSNFGFISELLSFCAHSGTHMDALAHVTTGPNDEWYGGHSAHEFLGDHGPTVNDARELPPFLCRGVLLDIPVALGVDRLEAGQGVNSALIQEVERKQGVSLQDHDVVLVRTGTMSRWPDAQAMAESDGSGVDLDGAEYLAGFSPWAVGADTGGFERTPSGIPEEIQPVHRLLIHDLGVPIMEWVNLEPLSQAACYEFLFVCLPLPITGATGSLIRPLAVV